MLLICQYQYCVGAIIHSEHSDVHRNNASDCRFELFCPELQQSAHLWPCRPPLSLNLSRSCVFTDSARTPRGVKHITQRCVKLADPVSLGGIYTFTHRGFFITSHTHIYSTDKNTHPLPPLQWTDKHMMRSVKKNHKHFLLIIWITAVALTHRQCCKQCPLYNGRKTASNVRCSHIQSSPWQNIYCIELQFILRWFI